MKIYIVDAFTIKPFSGNPAGVCIVENKITDELMQSIAMEVNLSETAFIKKEGEDFSLRWFTPTSEVPLCGHATLASAHILWEENIVAKSSTINFSTKKSGSLKIKYENYKIVMNFPQKFITTSLSNDAFQNALGLKSFYIGSDETDYLIEVESEEILKNCKPNFNLLKQLDKSVIVTAQSTNTEYDFVSRMFAPNLGINEDPVTGSAHCYLAPYWEKELNKKNLTGYQVSHRPGIVECELIDTSRVLLKGTAKTVIKGKLFL